MSGELVAGDVIGGKYEIMDSIGAGASGFVYLAKDLARPDVRWAIKEVQSNASPLADEPDLLDMFLKECEILRHLNHPGLPKVVDTLSEGFRHFLVMEYVEGESLQTELRAHDAPFSFTEVLSWTLQLTRILEYLHSQEPPVVFRDLKPSNIMRTSGGRLKLIDFGIARYFSPSKQKDTYIMGTPGFSAPEQYGTRQTDPRSDLYSLAATAYYLLTRQDMEQFNFDFPPVTTFAKDVPPWFSEILSRALQKEPARRFSSAAEMRQEIEQYSSAASSATRISITRSPSQVIPASLLSAISGSPAGIAAKKCITSGLLSLLGAMLIKMSTTLFPVVVGYLIALMAGILILSQLVDLLHYRRTVSTQKSTTCAWTFICIVVSLMLLLKPLSAHPGLQGKKDAYERCAANVRSIGVSCEMYAGDNGGQYPLTLDSLAPRYIEHIPRCTAPSAQAYIYQRDGSGEWYTIWCGSSTHKGHPAGHPRYSPASGLEK